LGKTKLAVKPAQVGTSNATKPENLGVFEYAHLRAPLPADLKGSEIFTTSANQQQPETYFLMRRSSDGYCSATGMFKIAFPWATQAEEKAERDYLKSLDTTSSDEVAGNIWIEPAYGRCTSAINPRGAACTDVSQQHWNLQNSTALVNGCGPCLTLPTFLRVLLATRNRSLRLPSSTPSI
jgi:hypothetical protein